MVHTLTYILVIVTFLLGVIGFQFYFRKHEPNYGYGKLILICIASEFLLLTLVVILPDVFQILIYGSVLMGCYVCTYYRFRKKVGGEW